MPGISFYFGPKGLVDRKAGRVRLDKLCFMLGFAGRDRSLVDFGNERLLYYRLLFDLWRSGSPLPLKGAKVFGEVVKI